MLISSNPIVLCRKATLLPFGKLSEGMGKNNNKQRRPECQREYSLTGFTHFDQWISTTLKEIYIL